MVHDPSDPSDPKIIKEEAASAIARLLHEYNVHRYPPENTQSPANIINLFSRRWPELRRLAHQLHDAIEAERPNFEAGKHYKTRGGDVALIQDIGIALPGFMTGRLRGGTNAWSWLLSGRINNGAPDSPFDLIPGEIDPRKAFDTGPTEVHEPEYMEAFRPTTTPVQELRRAIQEMRAEMESGRRGLISRLDLQSRELTDLRAHCKDLGGMIRRECGEREAQLTAVQEKQDTHNKAASQEFAEIRHRLFALKARLDRFMPSTAAMGDHAAETMNEAIYGDRIKPGDIVRKGGGIDKGDVLATYNCDDRAFAVVKMPGGGHYVIPFDQLEVIGRKQSVHDTINRKA